jgi:heavy metal translocating P-type ATPase
MTIERVLRWSLVIVAIVGLAIGVAAHFAGRSSLADICWTLATVPVMAGLAISIGRDLVAGRLGVDAIALLSMTAALALGEPLAGAVIALMYSGGNVLEVIAVSRAERNLRSLVDRAPRVAHRRVDNGTVDVPVSEIAVGDGLLVRAGEVIPVDGIIDAESATIDESALTGEPIPVTKSRGAAIYSGSLNADQSFEMKASAVAGESTYAGILRLVTAAQTAKAPFVRLADRYALAFLPFTVAVAFVAWLISGDPIRSLAVLVAATPCPLILAAPVAFIAGVARAARLGILVKGGGPLEALARAHTVLFDKTGTLTVGGARLLSIEVAPGEKADEVLAMAASLEQASQHIVAAAIVKAATDRGLLLKMPTNVTETAGSGLRGVVEGSRVSAGSRDFVFAHRKLPDWTTRAIRRASWRSALVVLVAVDDLPVGALVLADELRLETPHAVRMLREAGVARIVMVTGDHAAAAQTIGAALDLDSVLADRVPSDKVDAVRAEQRLHLTVMVGDGINDAPALASADVGIALGARGAGASSEAADVVILADRLDRVPEAILVAQRARRIAIESIVVGMGLSTLAMAAATVGSLAPVPAAIVQEIIDVAVIANALRALRPAHGRTRRRLPETIGRDLQRQHLFLLRSLDRLRSIADALDDAAPENAITLIKEADSIVRVQVVEHERDDEGIVYPKLAKVLADDHGLSAMSRAHREILHLARLLARIVEDLPSEKIDGKIDRYLVRDGQRMIEGIEALVRIHTAQEDDIYDAIATPSRQSGRIYSGQTWRRALGIGLGCFGRALRTMKI